HLKRNILIKCWRYCHLCHPDREGCKSRKGGFKMREASIERKLRREVARRGGRALKFISPGWSGAPDRLVLLPAGKIIFVELKAPGKKPRPLQLKRHEELRQLGFHVEVFDSPEGVVEFIRRWVDEI